MYANLLKKAVLKDKPLFILLNISLFLLSFIFLITYFVLNSLQEVHLQPLRDVISYDIRIDEKNATLEDLEKIEKIDGIYLSSDLEIFSQDNNSAIKIRFADPKLYETQRFTSKFITFFSPEGEEDVTFSSHSSASPFKEYFFIKKSAANRAIIAKIDVIATSYFYSKSPVLSDMGFMKISYAKKLGLDCYWGIYTSDVKYVEKQLASLGIKYSTYRDFSTTLTTALTLERYMFMLTLFFIFIVLIILFYRMTIKFINENKKNINTLIFLGMDERKVFLLFSLPMEILSAISAILGSVVAIIFANSYSFKEIVFRLMFSENFGVELHSSTSFFIFYITICLFVMALFSFVLYLCAKNTKEVDFYE